MGRKGIADAVALACEAHRGAVDKAGAPYVLHPLRVMAAVGSEEAKMAAVLHDVVEDSAVSVEDLASWGYPAVVVEAVEALSKRPGESYSAFVERCAACPLAREVKRADLEDNMDVRRLPSVGERDLARLAKYHRAWLRLK